MDWKQIINDLEATGMLRKSIADSAGCWPSAITELHKGKIGNPRFPVAQALIALHAKHCKVGAGKTAKAA